MEKKLTVIVPCYNSEKYIDNTINCLLQQSYKDFEIICIDDCSKDDTYTHLKKYEKDIEIYKNKKNMGAAYCRNLGIKLAQSEFIGFMDSDDKIDCDYFEILMKEQQKNDADVVVTDILSINENNENDKYYSECCKGEVTKVNIIDNGMAASSCNKIIRKELLVKYPYLEGKINEDISSIIPIVVKAEKIAYTNKTKYYYIQRENSVQHKKLSKKKLDIFDAVNTCLKAIETEKDYPKYRDSILYHQIVVLYFFVLCREQDSFNRYFLLKKFIKMQKKYNLHINSHYESFLANACEDDRNYYSKLIYYLEKPNVYKLNTLVKERLEK